MGEFEEQVVGALRALRIDRLGTSWWFADDIVARPGREGLAEAVTERLYAGFFCPGIAVEVDPRPPGARIGSTGLPRPLAAVRDGDGCRRRGWSPAGAEDDVLIVERDGLRLRVPRGAVTGAADGSLLLTVPRVMAHLSPGFVTVLGARAPEEDDQLARLYWNLTAAAAPTAVVRLTTALDAMGVAHRFKVVSDPGGFARCDAGVLYVPRTHLEEVASVALAVAGELGPGLEPGVPALTRRLAPGLATAEDPGEGMSYGEHRCRLIAEGAIQAWEDGRTALDDRLAAVRRRFADDGVDLAVPFIDGGRGGCR